jgi:hypothetical protein
MTRVELFVVSQQLNSSANSREVSTSEGDLLDYCSVYLLWEAEFGIVELPTPLREDPF